MDTITELFAIDPFQLSDQNIEQIIEYYRRQRQEFLANGKPPKEKPEIDLKSLGLL
jgi:hypothetical protein